MTYKRLRKNRRGCDIRQRGIFFCFQRWRKILAATNLQILAWWQQMWLTKRQQNLCQQQIEEIASLLAEFTMWKHTKAKAQVNIKIS